MAIGDLREASIAGAATRKQQNATTIGNGLVLLLGRERVADLTPADRIEVLEKALTDIKRLKPTPIGDTGFVTGPAALLRRAQEVARKATTRKALAALEQDRG
jgi:hypothetical protein